MELTLSTSDHALFPLLHFVLDDLPTSTKSPELNDQNMRLILKKTGVDCGDMEKLLPLYLGYLCYVGFLETPQKQLPKLKEWDQLDVSKMVSRSGN